MSNDLVALTQLRALFRSGTARAVRVTAGLSVGEVARAVGASKATIHRWERRERIPRLGPAALRYGQLLRDLVEAR